MNHSAGTDVAGELPEWDLCVGNTEASHKGLYLSYLMHRYLRSLPGWLHLRLSAHAPQPPAHLSFMIK